MNWNISNLKMILGGLKKKNYPCSLQVHVGDTDNYLIIACLQAVSRMSSSMGVWKKKKTQPQMGGLLKIKNGMVFNKPHLLFEYASNNKYILNYHPAYEEMWPHYLLHDIIWLGLLWKTVQRDLAKIIWYSSPSTEHWDLPDHELLLSQFRFWQSICFYRSCIFFPWISCLCTCMCICLYVYMYVDPWICVQLCVVMMNVCPQWQSPRVTFCFNFKDMLSIGLKLVEIVWLAGYLLLPPPQYWWDHRCAPYWLTGFLINDMRNRVRLTQLALYRLGFSLGPSLCL